MPQWRKVQAVRPRVQAGPARLVHPRGFRQAWLGQACVLAVASQAGSRSPRSSAAAVTTETCVGLADHILGNS